VSREIIAYLLVPWSRSTGAKADTPYSTIGEATDKRSAVTCYGSLNDRWREAAEED